MKVAVLYSGGKDSTHAIEYCRERNWDIKYLLSIKPSRTDCYLFHYATVEMTRETSKILGLDHIFVKCDIADPVKEAKIVKEIITENPVDAVVLGGTGLQVTQLKSIQDVLLPYGIEVFASHAEVDHEDAFRDLINKGYKVMVTQVAGEGISKWLGKIIDKDNFDEMKADSKKYGFHIGFEGGPADTLVLDCPFFSKKIDVLKYHVNKDGEYAGHVVIDNFNIVDKAEIKEVKE
ncbi:hypothetical protein CL617_01880 [archaeon]|nr:hypothetical protein [archaeon]|tara:strand:+ start:7655 stop:8356 length:702 start_codon:yes stop_codon:yes gene_type:complete